MEYRRSKISPQYFFIECRQEIQQDIVYPIAEKVRESIPLDLRSTVEILCFYRHLNASLLNHLIESKQIIWSTDGFHLMKELTIASLAGWLDQFHRVIHDDILFSMLVRLHATEKKVDLRLSYQAARTTCELELEIANENRCLWAVDIWYCYLAARTLANESIDERRLDEHRLDERRLLRRDFLENELKPVLTKLTGNLDPHADRKSLLLAERESLLGVLDNDGEFRFLLNYSLRSVDFTEEPYTTIRLNIEAFFEEAIGR